MITTTTPVEVIVGVDTHKDVHAAVAISALGVQLSATTIPVSSKGCQALETWATSLGNIRAIGIEGAGSYGAGLTRFLREKGHAVIEANRPNRHSDTRKARATPSMPRTPPVPCWPARRPGSRKPAPARSR